MLATNVLNDTSDIATNSDSITLEDAMEVIAAAAAVAFLVVDYFFHDNVRKWKN